LRYCHKTLGYEEVERIMCFKKALDVVSTAREGVLLLQRNANHQAKAENRFHRAVSMARNQQAKSFEL
jgi:hypothetical protein